MPRPPHGITPHHDAPSTRAPSWPERSTLGPPDQDSAAVGAAERGVDSAGVHIGHDRRARGYLRLGAAPAAVAGSARSSTPSAVANSGQHVHLPDHKPHPCGHPGAAANQPLMRFVSHDMSCSFRVSPRYHVRGQRSKLLFWASTARSALQIVRPRASRTTDRSWEIAEIFLPSEIVVS